MLGVSEQASTARRDDGISHLHKRAHLLSEDVIASSREDVHRAIENRWWGMVGTSVATAIINARIYVDEILNC